jgi:hypothetical protein
MISSVKVSVPGGMTTAQRDALGFSLKPGTEIYNTDTGRYEMTPDGGSTWEVSAFTSDITSSDGLNNAYLADPTIILDGTNPVTIQVPYTLDIAYAAPAIGAINGLSYIQGFSFTPSVDGFLISSQYNDLFFPSGTRLVQIYERFTQTLLISTLVAKTDPIVSGFRTTTNLFPVYVRSGVQYVVSVVVPVSELYNNVVIPAIAPITITDAAETPGTSTPGFPTTFIPGSVPRAGGFEFVTKTSFRNFQLENALSVNNNFLELNNSNIIYQTAINATSNFGSDVKKIMSVTFGGIPQYSLCKASGISDLAIEIVGNADAGTTAIIAIAANTTTLANQIQEVWGLRLVRVIAATNILRGDQLRKATGVGNSGKVTTSGTASGTFAVALQSVSAGQTLLAALMLSTA